MAMINGNALAGLGEMKVYEHTFRGRVYPLHVAVDENGDWVGLQAVIDALERDMANAPLPPTDTRSRHEKDVAAENLRQSNLWSAEKLRVEQETAAAKKKLDDLLAAAEKSLADAKALEDKAKESKSAADIATADAAKIKAANDKAAADKAAIDLEKAKADSSGNNKSLIDGMDNKTLMLIAAGVVGVLLLSKK